MTENAKDQEAKDRGIQIIKKAGSINPGTAHSLFKSIPEFQGIGIQFPGLGPEG